MSKSTLKPGRLFLIATPIGNLEDISLRALRTLKEVDLILAEDTRRTRKLCARYQISTPLRAFHEHSSPALMEWVRRQIADGVTMALVSDAGTPLISDPGAALVRILTSGGIEVEMVPGPSAVTAAAALSGLCEEGYCFMGFLPRKGTQRDRVLRDISLNRFATILFESAQRIHTTLAELAELCGDDRPAVLCRELTKVHEEVIYASLGELTIRMESAIKGEITLVLQGRAQRDKDNVRDNDLDRALTSALETSAPIKEIATLLAQRYALPRRVVYQSLIRRGS